MLILRVLSLMLVEHGAWGDAAGKFAGHRRRSLEGGVNIVDVWLLHGHSVVVLGVSLAANAGHSAS